MPATACRITGMCLNEGLADLAVFFFRSSFHFLLVVFVKGKLTVSQFQNNKESVDLNNLLYSYEKVSLLTH